MKFSHLFTLVSLLAAPAFVIAGQEIDCKTALEKIDKGSIVVDVRTKAEFDAGHLDKALNIPYDVIDRNLGVLPRDREIVLYCRSGRRSGIAKETLQKLGYANAVNAGGYAELSRCR